MNFADQISVNLEDSALFCSYNNTWKSLRSQFNVLKFQTSDATQTPTSVHSSLPCQISLFILVILNRSTSLFVILLLNFFLKIICFCQIQCVLSIHNFRSVYVLQHTTYTWWRMPVAVPMQQAYTYIRFGLR